MSSLPDIGELGRSEHVGPNMTGDNIDAKRSANYSWDPNTSQWVRTATDNKLDAQTLLLQQIEANTEAMQALCVVVKTLHQATVNPPYIDKSANAIRNQVQSGTITTVTTVTTVTNLTNFGTQAADVTYRINSLTAWANSVRRTIS